jgi:filamin
LQFSVDRTKSGFGELSVTIDTPQGEKIPFTYENDSKTKLRFSTNEIGSHRISIKMGDFHIRGSQFELNSIVPMLPVAHGEGLYHGLENEECLFLLQMPSSTDGQLDIEITGPNKNYVTSSIKKLTDRTYEISYFPDEIGYYRISIKYNLRDIPSSPFLSKVTNPKKLKVIGEHEYFFGSLNTKIYDFELNEEKFFCFDSSEVGPGNK